VGQSQISVSDSWQVRRQSDSHLNVIRDEEYNVELCHEVGVGFDRHPSGTHLIGEHVHGFVELAVERKPKPHLSGPGSGPGLGLDEREKVIQIVTPKRVDVG
jgi:hypothetical protein